MSNTTKIKIGGIEITQGGPPIIVAEMSGNHGQSLDRALKIAEEAARAGCQALKIQTYTADTMTLPLLQGGFRITEEGSLWRGRTLHELYQEAHTPWEWHEPIFRRCRELGLICFSTPFDESAVEYLESLNVPAYKIASFENIDLPFLRRVAQTGKPVIMSTGMASVAELDEAVSCLRENGCRDLVLLKCTSAYPAPPEDCNLRTIPHLSQLFAVPVGLSDHTLGIGVALTSIALGACMIEKHFTIDRNEGGPDAAFSLEPAEMAALTRSVKEAYAALGQVQYGPAAHEEGSLMFRRSLYAVEDIEIGDELTRANVRSIRPSFGLKPKHLDAILGMHAVVRIPKGSPLKWDMFR